jgi:hypothetical protein
VNVNEGHAKVGQEDDQTNVELLLEEFLAVIPQILASKVYLQKREIAKSISSYSSAPGF